MIITIQEVKGIDNDEIDGIEEYISENPDILIWKGKEEMLFCLSCYGIKPKYDTPPSNDHIASAYLSFHLQRECDIESGQFWITASVMSLHDVKVLPQQQEQDNA